MISRTWSTGVRFGDLAGQEPFTDLKLDSLKRRLFDGYKWSESGLLVMESIPHKKNYQQKGRPSDESRFIRQSDFRRVFTCKENGPRFHPSHVTKINRFGGKGILVWGGKKLNSRIPLYIFETDSVTHSAKGMSSWKPI
ncbi:hypothetical protein TNCV_1316141 [Trichonephila clavipes]|nr:hypothetical protein TNCV_1316141 [Trichonephila clavipes]